jgi:hypothetical protein
MSKKKKIYFVGAAMMFLIAGVAGHTGIQCEPYAACSCLMWFMFLAEI